MKKMIALLLIAALLLSGCSLKNNETANPDEYVEHANNSPSEKPATEQSTPPKKEERDQKESPADKKTSQKEEILSPKQEKPINFAEAYKDMIHGEAITIVRRKAQFSAFHKKPTAEQRMAIFLLSGNENFLYLAAQAEGLISNFKYAEGETLLNINIYTTKEAVGSPLIKQYPLKLSEKNITQKSLDQTVLSVDKIPDSAGVLRYYTRETENPKEYLEFVSYQKVSPQGLIRNQLNLGSSQKVSKSLVEQILLHYLSIEEVVWVEMSFAEKKEESNPAKKHPFWEWPEEFTYEQARQMALEKLNKRIDEKLSLRERKAFYLLTNEITARMIGRGDYVDLIRLGATKAGASFNPLQELPDEFAKEGVYFSADYETVGQYTKKNANQSFYINLPEKPVFRDLLLTPMPKYKFVIEPGYVAPPKTQKIDKKTVFPAILRHYWSIDCITWVELSYTARYAYNEIINQ